MLSPMAEPRRDRTKLIRLTIEVEPDTYKALMAYRAEVRRPTTRIVEEWIIEKLDAEEAKLAQQ